VTQRAAHGGKCDACIATRRLGDFGAWFDDALRIGGLEDVQRHPVLDAAGEIERLVLGVDVVRAAAKPALDLDQGCATGETLQGGKTCGQVSGNRHVFIRRSFR
jgi:hypothetical protein